jgi:hypothetical protein
MKRQYTNRRYLDALNERARVRWGDGHQFASSN